MGIAAAAAAAFSVVLDSCFAAKPPMSRGFRPQGSLYGFSSDGYDAAGDARDVDGGGADHVIAQQSRREKMHDLIQSTSGDVGQPVLEEDVGGEPLPPAYEPAAAGASTNMLSEMFYPASVTVAHPSASELLASQMAAAAAAHQFAGFRAAASSPSVFLSDGNWYGSTSRTVPDSAAGMNLFLINPEAAQAQLAAGNPASSSSTQHDHPSLQHHLHAMAGAAGHVLEGQGLSLSLSPALQQLEMHPSYNLARAGAGAVAAANLLRTSKYARAAQELLQEFCSVGPQRRGGTGAGGASTSATGAAASSKEKEEAPPPSPAPAAAAPQLSATERFEQQRKKAKLTAMLDEVERRYSHYCEQMQAVVNCFDGVVGVGAAAPYTAQAQKAMSRHFRCLKDAVAGQLRRSCEALGEKFQGAGTGLTKGDTPRLRVLDLSIRQQRAFAGAAAAGIFDGGAGAGAEAWRPQRGLPERSVNILRAWLFEHFLHPYPSDADKHLLSRQTGLSRNQVSNWFINARVRLWKPMIEDMYQQELKELDDQQGAPSSSEPSSDPGTGSSGAYHRMMIKAESSARYLGAPASTMPAPPAVVDPTALLGVIDPAEFIGSQQQDEGSSPQYRYTQLAAAGAAGGAPVVMRLGAPPGDVSLTLGLRYPGAGGTPRGGAAGGSGGIRPPFSFGDYRNS